MSKSSKIGLTQANPGVLVYYTLNHLTRYARENGVTFDDWGICGYENVFWVGRDVFIGGKQALKLPLLEVLDMRNEKYPEWGDEDILLFVGIDGQSGEFKWFILNREESKMAMTQYNDCAPVMN